jgi:hypothetical protein
MEPVDEPHRVGEQLSLVGVMLQHVCSSDFVACAAGLGPRRRASSVWRRDPPRFEPATWDSAGWFLTLQKPPCPPPSIQRKTKCTVNLKHSRFDDMLQTSPA